MRRLLLAVIATFPFSLQAQERFPVEEALEQYVQAMESGDAEKVVALYDKNAVFFSMIATKPLTTQAERLEYYKKAVAEPDLSVDIDDENPQMTGDTATNTGTYIFRYTQEGEEMEIPGRFSFTYIWKNGKWLITEHRSTKIDDTKDKQ